MLYTSLGFHFESLFGRQILQKGALKPEEIKLEGDFMSLLPRFRSRAVGFLHCQLSELITA